MILEFSIDYRTSSSIYEKLFLETLKEHSLNGKIVKEHFLLKLYVEADTADALESFATSLSSVLPHSIFVRQTSAQLVEEMPDTDYEIEEQKKYPLPFCPQCLQRVMDSKNRDYYNIYTACDACGYNVSGENRSYKKEFEEAAVTIKAGKVLEVNTFYGKYYVGIPAKICNTIPFDIVVYDLATVEKYANVEKYEIMALGSFEKPLIKLKKKLSFTMDHEEVEADLIRFKLPDDFILHLLMEELHNVGIDAVFIAKKKIPAQKKLLLTDFKEELDPIEVVVSENDVVIVSGEKGLPQFPLNAKEVNPSIGSFFSVVREHQLVDENIAGISLSKEYKNNLLVYGKKYGIVEYLSFNFEFESMQEIFDKIVNSDENGSKIVANYQKKYPEHFERISGIIFEDKSFNLFRLWGVVAMVLDYTSSIDPIKAAEVLEENAISFLGEKGPRIDYKLLNMDGKVYLDPLMTIRTAMSFRLAGVDPLMLSYGVIESFLEFLANELDEMKQNMDITAITASGSLLSNKHLFSKMSREISINHNIYFNNELPVDGRNMFYGGMSL